jgi:deoxyhypusine synthase
VKNFYMNIKCEHGDGSHLTIDAFDCKADLNDKKLIMTMLNELPKQLGMKAITEPQVVSYEDTKEKESGVTGFVVIAESHIAIHTYPEKNFFSADIFSCKEFDYMRAVEYFRDAFKAGKIDHKVISRGYEDKFDIDGKLKNVKGFKLENKKVLDLLDDMETVGFQATHLNKASKIIEKMKKEDATVFLSFTSNMVSSGLREVFAQIVKHNMVDAIITSVGSIEEDLMKVNTPFLLGDFNVSDVDLHKKGTNRIGNIFVPTDRYESLEGLLQPFFGKMLEKQKASGKLISPSELIYELGKTVKDENSIIYWATKNNIPIFCPGITDGALGLQAYFFKQEHEDFGIDVTADMNKAAEMIITAEKTAGIILGGGIAKHHLIGLNILRDGLDYAVYMTTAGEGDGSLSGARPKEAKSWSKIKEEGNVALVEGDVTITFPFLAIKMKEVFK